MVVYGWANAFKEPVRFDGATCVALGNMTNLGCVMSADACTASAWSVGLSVGIPLLVALYATRRSRLGWLVAAATVVSAAVFEASQLGSVVCDPWGLLPAYLRLKGLHDVAYTAGTGLDAELNAVIAVAHGMGAYTVRALTAVAIPALLMDCAGALWTMTTWTPSVQKVVTGFGDHGSHATYTIRANSNTIVNGNKCHIYLAGDLGVDEADEVLTEM